MYFDVYIFTCKVGCDAEYNWITNEKVKNKECWYVKWVPYVRIRIPCIQEQGHPSLSPHGVIFARAKYRFRHLSGALLRHNASVLFFVLPFVDRRADVVFRVLHEIRLVSVYNDRELVEKKLEGWSELTALRDSTVERTLSNVCSDSSDIYRKRQQGEMKKWRVNSQYHQLVCP